MDTNQLEIREERLRQWTQSFPYPPTPDIAGAVARNLDGEAIQRRNPHPRLTWAAVVILLLVALMAVPPVRAQILEFLQIGAIRIFLTEPTSTATPDHPKISPPVEELGNQVIDTATPRPSAAVYPSVANLAGETTLKEARNELDFTILLPTYPPDLGQPDRVFLQDFDGQAVLILWTDSEQREHIRMNMLILGPGTFAQKGLPAIIEEVSVHGQRAIWTEGPHFLQMSGNMYQTVPLVVEGNILIWEQDGLTYRLETDLPLEEAIKVAESLK